MKLAAIAFTEQGMKLGKRICGCVEFDMTLTRCEKGMLNNWTQRQFYSGNALLFLGSTGIAVRAIAPYVQSKSKDPAVVVMDELGTFAIPILSGHIGGANQLALALSQFTGAHPVITTATDINGMFAVDTWAKKQRLTILNPERIKLISASLLAGQNIGMYSLYSVAGNLPNGVVWDNETYDVLVSHQTCGRREVLQLIPPIVTVGIGCKKGVSADIIETAYKTVLYEAHCHALSVCQVCSIVRKANEPGILEFCRRRGLPYRTFSVSELAAVPGEFTASAFVEKITGLDNICERAAVLGSGGTLLSKKEAQNGVTIALAIGEPKLCFEEEA